jgi:hypothetical protein
MNSRTLVALLLALSALAGGCALRSPTIADVQHHPTRYADRTIEVRGVVTSSWGVPLVPFTFYKVSDGSGELTVVGRGSRVPARGTRVKVRGRVNEVAMLGGRSVGLHLEERDLRVERRGW